MGLRIDASTLWKCRTLDVWRIVSNAFRPPCPIFVCWQHLPAADCGEQLPATGGGAGGKNATGGLADDDDSDDDNDDDYYDDVEGDDDVSAAATSTATAAAGTPPAAGEGEKKKKYRSTRTTKGMTFYLCVDAWSTPGKRKSIIIHFYIPSR